MVLRTTATQDHGPKASAALGDPRPRFPTDQDAGRLGLQMGEHELCIFEHLPV